MSFFSTLVSANLQRGFVFSMRNNTYRALFRTQWQYLNREYMSDFIRLVTNQVQSVGASLHQLLGLANHLVMVLVYLFFALALSPELTFFALLCALLLVALLLPINQLIYASSNRELTATRKIYRSVFEQLSSLKVIKSFAAEEKYLCRMEQINHKLEQQQVQITAFHAFTRFLNLVGAAVIFCGLFYLSIGRLQLPVSNLILIIFIFSRLMPKVSAVQAALQQLIQRAPEYSDLLEKIHFLEENKETLNGDLKPPRLTQEMVLENISYQYSGKNTPVFNHLNVRILHNQTTAIVGPSGAGKSTLADIISGLIPPSSGSILVDGQAINEANRCQWRKHVAYVTQDVFLFHDSVRNNLSWISDEPVTDQEIQEALTLSAADQFVNDLPQGLDTLIGDRGVKLSGGERQRIALARALLSKPDILILDEATSSLDKSNEFKIRDALMGLDGHLTVLIIAHNETTIEHVKNRIVLSHDSSD